MAIFSKYTPKHINRNIICFQKLFYEPIIPHSKHVAKIILVHISKWQYFQLLHTVGAEIISGRVEIFRGGLRNFQGLRIFR